MNKGGRPVGSFKFGSHAHRVLTLINLHPGSTFGEIVALTRFPRGSVAHTLNRLTKTGLVIRKLAPRAFSVRGKRVWSYTAAGSL